MHQRSHQEDGGTTSGGARIFVPDLGDDAIEKRIGLDHESRARLEERAVAHCPGRVAVVQDPDGVGLMVFRVQQRVCSQVLVR